MIRLRPAAVVLAAALALAACSMEAEQSIDVRDDDTFDYAMDLSLTTAAPLDLDALGAQQPEAGEMEADLAEFADEIGARDSAVEQHTDGNEFNLSMSLDGVPIEHAGELAQGGELGDEAGEMAGDEHPLVSDLAITADNGDYRFEATLASLGALGEEMTPDDELGEDAPFDADDMEMASTVVLTLPGEVTDHNADAHDDETGALTWNAEPDTDREIHAASTTGGGLLPWLAIAAAVAAVAVAIVLARRRRTPAAPAGGGDNPFASPGERATADVAAGGEAGGEGPA